MKAQEPDVALVAAIRPDEQKRIENMFEKASTSRTPHQGTLALRAFIHSFGKQELHRNVGTSGLI
jgi:hypothetical protein